MKEAERGFVQWWDRTIRTKRTAHSDKDKKTTHQHGVVHPGQHGLGLRAPLQEAPELLRVLGRVPVARGRADEDAHAHLRVCVWIGE